MTSDDARTDEHDRTEQWRIEHDTMGEVRVPREALWAAQTQRAVENFPISGTRLERSHIEALARIKKAAAQANAELGVLDADHARQIGMKGTPGGAYDSLAFFEAHVDALRARGL